MKQKNWITSILTSFLVVGTLLSPFSGISKPVKADTPSQTNSNDPVEVPNLETANSRVYQNPDGTLTSKVYFAPVNYQGSNGVYQHIDTNVQPDGSDEYSILNNSFQTHFNSSATSSDLETIDYKGKQVSFSIAPDSLGQQLNTHAFSNLSNVTGTKDQNQMAYKSVYPNVDFKEEVTSLGVKEVMVINKYTPGLNTFVFDLNTKGVTATQASDGSIVFTDDSGQTVFTIPTGVMQDSNVDPHSGDSATSNNVTYTLKQIGGHTLLGVTLDENWLKDPSRVYPVYVDPSFTVQSQITDANVSSAYPTTNYSGTSALYNSETGNYDLKSGYYDSTTGTYWAYFKLPTASQLPLLGLTVTSATFNAYCDWSYYTSTAEPTYLFPNTSSSWSPSSITWNTRPSHATSYLSQDSVYRGQWAQFDITSMAQDWSNEISGASHTYSPEEGLFLDESGQGQTYWHKFVAMENGTDQPYITINYAAPTAPWGAIYTHSDNTTGYVNLWWNPVPGASSYNVEVYNGHSYEAYSVTPQNGNTEPQEWTSKNKGIWPTASEISSGVWQLHHDQKGTELPMDPDPVYKNAYNANGGTDYSTRNNFWFRVSVVKNGQVTNNSDPYEPIMQPYIPDEGEAPTMVPLKVGEADAATGNFVESSTDLTTTGIGPQVSIDRTYNENESNQIGPLGTGWTLGYQSEIKPNGNNVELLNPDGSTSLYFSQESGTDFISPTGQADGTLNFSSNIYTLTMPDETREIFTEPSGGDGSQFLLTQIKDAQDNTMTLKYGSEVNGIYPLTSITDTNNHTTTITENSNGQITTIADASGNKWSYGYNGSQQLISVTDPDGNTTQYGYTGNQLTSVTDPNGNPYTLSYNSSGQIISETDPTGKSQTLSYSPTSPTSTSDATMSFTDSNGTVTQYTFGLDNLLKKEVVDPTGKDQVTTINSYNEFNEPTSETDPNGNTTTSSYDQFGQLESSQDADNNTTTISHDNSTLQSENTDVTTVQNKVGASNFGYGNKYDQTVNEQPQGEKTDTSNDSNGNPLSDVTVPADNILPNNSFESWDSTNSEATNWGIYSSSGSTYTSTQSSNSVFGGKSWAMKNATGTVAVYPVPVTGTYKNEIDGNGNYTISPDGVSFEAMVYATTQAAAQSTYAKLDIFNKSGSKIAQINGPVLGVANKWVEISVSLSPEQLPSGATACLPGIRTIPGSGEVDMDAADLNPNSSLVPDYNVLSDGSFTNGLTNWTSNGNITTNSSNVLLGDSSSAEITTSSSSSSDIEPSDSAEDIPYVAGQSYNFGGFVKGSNVGNTNFELQFLDSNKNVLGEISSSTLSGNFDWSSGVVSLNSSTSVPSGTAFVEPELVTTAASGGTLYADDLYLTLNSESKNYTYDTNGNQTGTTNPLGDGSTSTYDSEGNETSTTDANGNKTSMTYDSDGNLLSQLLPNGLSLNSTYDADGNVTKETASGSGLTTQTKTNTYNSLNQIASTTDPLNQTTKYTYDSNGDLTTTTLPDGHQVTIGYDAVGNPTSVSVDGTIATLTTYDSDNNVSKIASGSLSTSFTRDGDGNITSQTDNVGSQTFGYNADDVQTSHSFTVGSTTWSETVQRNYQDQLTGILNGSSTLASYGYNQANQIDTVELGNGMKAMYRYDGDHRISSLIINGPSSTFAAYGYQYDKNGNITTITDLLMNKTVASYQYDNMNQLTQETQVDGTVVKYTYDALGNILTKAITQNGNTTTTNYTYNAGNELTSVNGQANTYDGNGNLTNDGTYSYTWNDLGEFQEVDNATTGAPIATYTYDGMQRRASETANGTTTDFYYEGDSKLVSYETDGSGNLLRSYTYNDQNQPVTMTTWSGGTGTTYYYQLNGQGDVIALTDNSGNTVAQYTYDAWGNILTKTGALADTNPYLYRGYRWDSSVGLYYLNERYYSAFTMRFISQDPVDNANLYNYTNNNPVNMFDPTGAQEEDAEDGGPAAEPGELPIVEAPKARTGGRLGNAATRAQNQEIVKLLEYHGWDVQQEEFLKGPVARSTKGSNYVDITARKGGRELRIQTVDTYKRSGRPTVRELRNARSIRGKTKSVVILIPKGAGTGTLGSVISKL